MPGKKQRRIKKGEVIKADFLNEMAEGVDTLQGFLVDPKDANMDSRWAKGKVTFMNAYRWKLFTEWIKKGVKTFSMYGYHYDAVRGVDAAYYIPLVNVLQDELKFLAKNSYMGFASEMGGKYAPLSMIPEDLSVN